MTAHAQKRGVRTGCRANGSATIEQVRPHPGFPTDSSMMASRSGKRRGDSHNETWHQIDLGHLFAIMPTWPELSISQGAKMRLLAPC